MDVFAHSIIETICRLLLLDGRLQLQLTNLRANSPVRKPVDFARFAEPINQLQMYWLVLNESPKTTR